MAIRARPCKPPGDAERRRKPGFERQDRRQLGIENAAMNRFNPGS
jgi:hypothetical protein